jgi:hypothetical protein
VIHGRFSQEKRKMPINLGRPPGRKHVAWLDIEPPAEGRDAFVERGFKVTMCSENDLRSADFLAGLTAVVFVQSAQKPLQIASYIENHAARLLDYDCQIILRPGSEELSFEPTILTNTVNKIRLWTAWLPPKQAALLKWLGPPGALPPFPRAHFFSFEILWTDIANVVAENPPGPAPNTSLQISVQPVTGGAPAPSLSDDEKLLIRRAFSDCADISLEPVGGGRSGLSVYRAHAELEQGLEGRWPQPYFVKIGDRQKVFAEYENYEGRVRPYVPFHLGPHLDSKRCCLGARKGVIVGDYVEESESLRDCACEGRAASAIACLFDRTLLGWHRVFETKQSSIANALKYRFPERIFEPRRSRATALGATLTLPQLRKLFRRCTSRPILIGLVHGDLHSANVRVRATDAIVIDFFAHQKYPLVFDAATLEASLFVEGFRDDRQNPQDWLKSVEPLYTQSPLLGTLPHVNPKNASFWFYACVHQIRRYARQWECAENQYAGALAVALLIKATKDMQVPEPEASRRAAAYVLAERLLMATFGGVAATSVNVPAVAPLIPPTIPSQTISGTAV